MTFYYTDADLDIDSSAVYEVYYNANDKNLAVVLSSGHAYQYSGVPKEVYERLTETGFAKSPGRVYAKTIKRDYGPGTPLGYVGEESDEFQSVESLVDFEPVAVASGVGHAAVGTPKGLTYAENAVVTGSNEATAAYIGLASTNTSTVATTPKRKHAVVFTVDGGNTRKTYNVDTESVDAAVKALREVADMLGVTANVKEVTVYFE